MNRIVYNGSDGDEKTKQQLQNPINSSRVPVKHVINTVFPSPISRTRCFLECNANSSNCNLYNEPNHLCLLNPFHNVRRVESLNQKQYLTLSPNLKRNERNYVTLNETSRNNYYRRNYMLENEIALLTESTRLPTCFPNKLTQILRLPLPSSLC